MIQLKISYLEDKTKSKCKLCQLDLNNDNSIKINLEFDNKEYKINKFCKFCIENKYINSTCDKGTILFWLDSSLLNKDYYDKQIKDLNMLEWVQTQEAKRLLNIKCKNQLKFLSKTNWIKSLKISSDMFNKNHYIHLYNKKDIEKYINLNKNGKYFQPTKSQKIKEIIENEPFYKKINNKQYLYCDYINNKKVCSNCLKINDFNDFSKNPKLIAGLSYFCKKCQQLEGKNRYKNLDKERKRELLKKVKEWRINNKEKIKAYLKNPQKKLILNIRKRLRSKIKHIFRIASQNGPFTHLMQINRAMFGCSELDLINHIQSLFIEDMSWNNYGPGYEIDKNGNPIYDIKGNIIKKKEWHLDHIIPISKFDFTNPVEINKINHYTNLRPMWATDNMNKQNKLDEDLEDSMILKYKIIKEKCKILKKNVNDVELLNQLESLI